MDMAAESPLTTEERIMLTAIDLMERKGFKAVTTKEIAHASGFSEMTVFRNFGTKQNILERAFETYSNHIDIEHEIKNKVEYNLSADLKKVAQVFQNYHADNRKMFLIGFQERNTNPNLIYTMAENPRELKRFLIDYFEEMKKLGRVRKSIDSHAQAMNFLWMNLGHFFSGHIAGQNVAEKTVELDDFIENAVEVFSYGLRPDCPDMK
ncbi:TetR/AcrR family transcriptional regulator [Salisediminibacterium halotolerans]|uniref:DNA-binding transcriptional regulator, AcrR family n=1 Tax=Salisediminibacterium halotolerans TaxID=517425 RepID=A0A1H9WTP4_9BACI|nr:TetR/AcrR family transcriptional regulator [Salisediminibacterium haloalkalitolerans]SES37057.1 DNA-binding transcriptional regulator, AcrR family [Salisediminibacterium haloalkalitolerans]